MTAKTWMAAGAEAFDTFAAARRASNRGYLLEKSEYTCLHCNQTVLAHTGDDGQCLFNPGTNYAACTVSRWEDLRIFAEIE